VLQSGFLLLFAHNLRHCLPLQLQFFSALQIVLSHLFEVLIEEDLPLLSVFRFLTLPENLENSLLQEIRVRVADIDELQCVLDCDFGATGKIIHQELDQIKEVPGLQSRFVENASLIHEGKLVFVYLAI